MGARHLIDLRPDTLSLETKEKKVAKEEKERRVRKDLVARATVKTVPGDDAAPSPGLHS